MAKVEYLAGVTASAPASREAAVAMLLEALAAACAEGEVCLIGSLAKQERADAYSDIDFRWTIPFRQAPGLLQSLRETLQRVGTVESLRVDPDVRPDVRLVFVRFEGWPLWWRVDLEIHSTGAGSLAVPGADPWSPHESACMGVVVTLKALARSRPEAAEELFVRARERVDAADIAGSWPGRIGSLLDRIATTGPPTEELVARTRQLAREVLGE
jgi:hypothetical protein